MSNPSGKQGSAVGPKAKIFTAMQHGSGLVVFLGLFLVVSALATGRNPQAVRIGLIMIALAAIGFLAGWVAGRRNQTVGKKNGTL